MCSPTNEVNAPSLLVTSLCKCCLLAVLLVAGELGAAAQDFLSTREYKVKGSAGKASFEATVEFPTEGAKQVREHVAAWLCETLEIEGQFTDNGQRLLQCACDSFLQSGQHWKRSVTVERSYEDAHCVTFQSWIKDVDKETWKTADCATFSKKDGHRIQIDEIFKCSEEELKNLMWEYRGDLELDAGCPEDLYPLNAGFVDGWVVVIAPAHHQMGAEFLLRYLEILPALRTSQEGYFAQ